MKSNLAKQIVMRSWWLGLAITAWAFLMFFTVPSRGFTQSGVWQIEQTESVNHWLGTLLVFGGDAFSPDSLWSAFTTDPYRGPLVGLYSAVTWRFLGIAEDAVQASHLANILLVCLTAWCLFSVARRAGGLLAGLMAAVALVSIPRVWAAASSPGLTASALFAFTAGACFMERARDRLRWFLPAVLILAMAVLTTQMALLLVLPWIVITFFGTQPSPRRGLLSSRPLSLWAPFVFPLALLLAFLAIVMAPGGTKEQLLSYLKAFVTRPRVETLYFGHVYSNDRLAWHAAPCLTALTVPPTVLFMTVYGLAVASPFARWLKRRFSKKPEESQSEPSREALRLSWAMLLLTLLMPLLFGTTYSHGVDLLALLLPWCAVFTGVGVARLLTKLALSLHTLLARHDWARWVVLVAVSLLGWSVFAFALRETDRAYPEVESYYSWLAGGLEGATWAGLPRYPHGPLPPYFLNRVLGPADQASVAIVAEPEDSWPVLEQYRRHGLIPEGLTSSPLQNAQFVLLRFNEVSADFYGQLPDFLSAASTLDAGRVDWLSRDGIPLYGALRLAD